VAEESTLEDSLILAFKNALVAAQVPQDKQDAVMAALASNKQKMLDALASGTPAELPPVA